MKHLSPRQLQKKFSKRVYILSILLSMSLMACSEQAKVPAQKKATSSAAAPSASAAISQQSVTQIAAAEYVYDGRGRKDPFAPIIVKETASAKSGDRPPLERYMVYDFKLTGVMWGGYGYNAMVEGPDGKGYFIKEGAILGQNKGIVKKITADKLIVEEQFKNYAGELEKKEILLDIRRKQEGL